MCTKSILSTTVFSIASSFVCVVYLISSDNLLNSEFRLFGAIALLCVIFNKETYFQDFNDSLESYSNILFWREREREREKERKREREAIIIIVI